LKLHAHSLILLDYFVYVLFLQELICYMFSLE